VIEAVDQLRLESVRINPRGTGDKEFPPHMLLALLICNYANGLFSSRKIERATPPSPPENSFERSTGKTTA
jgi:transposase